MLCWPCRYVLDAFLVAGQVSPPCTKQWWHKSPKCVAIAAILKSTPTAPLYPTTTTTTHVATLDITRLQYSTLHYRRCDGVWLWKIRTVLLLCLNGKNDFGFSLVRRIEFFVFVLMEAGLKFHDTHELFGYVFRIAWWNLMEWFEFQYDPGRGCCRSNNTWETSWPS